MDNIQQANATENYQPVPGKQNQNSGQPNFVAFRVSQQEYCVDILSVREISGGTHVTLLPKSANYVRGVINLRGTVVPVLDCPVRFGLTPQEPTGSDVIIVVRIGERTLGLLVDEVSEILNTPRCEIKTLPDAETAGATQLVAGVILMGERMIRVVDLNQIAPEIDMGTN